MKTKQILKVRRYKAGYEIRHELIDGSDYGGDDLTLKSAYTPEGHYIGNSRDGYRLCKVMGIKPELSVPEHNVCSIGWCETKQKWFGWSHRAIYGFEVGSTTKLGDCGYKPSNKDEFLDALKDWYNDGRYDKLKFTELGGGVHIISTMGELSSEQFEPYPDNWGKGEWTAYTLNDAKQMAKDFAEGVS